MLSVCGRCQALSSAADGYVRGEAAISMVLQGHQVADALGDSVEARGLCIIAGSAVNQDGRSSSLTAPNGQSQQVVLSDAWGAAKFPMHYMQGVAMHGTGTALGDPIEIGALMRCLPPRPQHTPLSLQANKASVGHGEAAAGISSLYYTLQSLIRNACRPVAHLRSVNPHVEAILPTSSHMAPRLPTALSQLPDMASGVSSFAYQVHTPYIFPNLYLCLLYIFT
jgi:acyl transferase domain-containing protein